jgi:hypothetical protein
MASSAAFLMKNMTLFVDAAMVAELRSPAMTGISPKTAPARRMSLWGKFQTERKKKKKKKKAAAPGVRVARGVPLLSMVTTEPENR